ncbi:uncharacterized protein METZ01_LOCUS458942 [marine metagenome]|uniref:Uncharacterized protein n=1 Tax=marine metagenome TaxID=408172 RepID=A0A383AG76_9ZZZZ
MFRKSSASHNSLKCVSISSIVEDGSTFLFCFKISKI